METSKRATVGQFGGVAHSESEKEKNRSTPERKRSWWRSALQRYGVALLLTGAAFLVRTSLTPVIGGEGPYLLFSPAALLAAWFGGRGPGIMASFLGVVLGDYFFTLPLHEFGPYGPAEITLIATYLLGTLVGVVLFDLLQRSRQRIQVSAEHERIAAGLARERSLELEREITEHKRTERQLESARSELAAINSELEERITDRTADLQESLGSLELVLYHVAHDLRAPLRAMSGFSTLLLQGYGDHIDQNAKEYGSRIAEASERMDVLLRDLLDYGRVCHTPIFSTRLPLDRVVGSVVRQFALKIESSAARMQVSSPLAVAQGDRKMVEEIVSRLLSNALKFVPPGEPPEISVYSELRNGLMRLSIEDNGIGIEPELQQRIFGVFERGTTDRQYPGTGIGLAIVRRAVERMRGTVGLMSKPGKGSCFWIELPAG